MKFSSFFPGHPCHWMAAKYSRNTRIPAEFYCVNKAMWEDSADSLHSPFVSCSIKGQIKVVGEQKNLSYKCFYVDLFGLVVWFFMKSVEVKGMVGLKCQGVVAIMSLTVDREWPPVSGCWHQHLPKHPHSHPALSKIKIRKQPWKNWTQAISTSQ